MCNYDAIKNFAWKSHYISWTEGVTDCEYDEIFLSSLSGSKLFMCW